MRSRLSDAVGGVAEAPHACTSYQPRPTTLEQGIAHRPEETSLAEARLVHSGSPRNRTIKARSCNL
jgi:hypothetical protein